MIQEQIQIIRLGRPQNTRVPIIFMVIFALLVGTQASQLMLCVILYVSAYQLVTIVNNIFDRKIDMQNKLTINPLANNKVSMVHVRLFAAILAVIFMVAMASLHSLQLAALMSTFIILGVLYSWPRGLSYRHYWGTLTLSLWYGALPIVMISFISHHSLYIEATGFAGLFSCWLLTKDYRDEIGDAAAGKLTPLVRFGPHNVLLISCILWLIASALLVYKSRDMFLIAPLLIYGLLVLYQHKKRAQSYKFFTALSLLTVLCMFALTF